MDFFIRGIKLDHLLINNKCFFVTFVCIKCLSLVKKFLALVHVATFIGGITLNCLIITGSSFFVALKFIEGCTFGCINCGIVGIKSDGFFVALTSFFKMSRSVERLPFI